MFLLSSFLLSILRHIIRVYETSTLHSKDDYYLREDGEIPTQVFPNFQILRERAIYTKDCNATCAGPAFAKTTAPSPCAAIPLPRAPCWCTRGVTNVLPVPVQYHVICYHHMNTYDHSPCSCLSYGRNIQDRKQQKDSCQKDFPSHSKLTPGLADAQTRLFMGSQ